MERFPILGGFNKMYFIINTDNINEEMHNQKNYNIYTFENEPEKLKRIKAISLAQINNYSYYMLSFKLEKSNITELIQNMLWYYQIDNEKQSEVFKNIDDYLLILNYPET